MVPCAKAAKLTMNREGIRRPAAEELGLPTSSYRFAGDKAAFMQAVEEIGYPCIVKPVMSSSGKGQSFIRDSGTGSRVGLCPAGRPCRSRSRNRRRRREV